MKRIFTLLTAAAAAVVMMAQTVQVWDLGAEQFADRQNMLSEAEINSWFSVAAGSKDVSFGDINASDSCNFKFVGAGKTNHRLRTTNTALTCYDRRSLTDGSGNTYRGYIYSNATATPGVYISQNYEAGDVVDFYVGSNGGTETYVLSAPSGQTTELVYGKSASVEKLTYYIGETGTHKFYGTDEKLVVARIVRTPATPATVTGSITAPANIPGDYQLGFVCVENFSEAIATRSGSSYSVSLAMNYHYIISLIDANGFVVTSENPIHITSASQVADITIGAVDLVTMQGTLTGLPASELCSVAFTISLPEGKVYQPELTIDCTNGDFTLVLERGVNYGVSVGGVNDYEFDRTTIGATEDMTGVTFAFTPKPTYRVSIAPTVVTVADLAEATFTFVNLEDQYTYTFTGTADIRLRDGVYSVKVSNSGIYVQLLTSNLRINGADVTKQIDFTAHVSEWNFSDADFTGGGYTNTSATYNYKTLGFTGCRAHQDTYLYGGNGGKITVPVQVGSVVTVKACYEYHLRVGTDTLGNIKTGSTGQIDALEYRYTGAEAGTVTIDVFGTSYINAISVREQVPYAATVSVGVGKDYLTINDALAAIRLMERTDEQGVTLMIEPGNYEEMLRIDVPRITLRNAAANPGIGLRDKGVGIDDNAVRITSYYGHSYNYYSQDAAGQWNERVLSVNKENGSYTRENQCGGSDFWNATVIVSSTDFSAYNIIFENSFNQYISAKEAQDVVVLQAGEKLPVRPTTVGDVSVQERSYRERACALAFSKTADRGYLENCRIVGRQDDLYGDAGPRVVAKGGVFMGACDYIYGEMTLVCYQTELAMNTTDGKNDAAYITAAKHSAGMRGFLFYDCHVTSVTPNTETANTHGSKPGYWGRPWSTMGETMFYHCTVDSTTCPGYSGSLIAPAGWNNGLTATGSPNSYEYATEEQAGVDNAGSRIAWSKVLTGLTPTLNDGKPVNVSTFLGTKSDGWNPLGDIPMYVSGLNESAAGKALDIRTTEGGISVCQLEAGALVQVYAADGQLVGSRRVADESVSFSVPSGLWIVRVSTTGHTAAAKVVVGH